MIKQYQRLFEMEDVKLSFTDDAMEAVAAKAIKRKTGARGLRSIMESILLDPMYDLPGMAGVEEVVVNKDAVEKSAQPLFVYSEENSSDAEPASA